MNSEAFEFLAKIREALIATDISYMVVGSTVVNWIGRPLTTFDVDIVIHPKRDQIIALVRRLSELGMYIDEHSAIDALARQSMVNALDADTGWKADFIMLRDDEYQRTSFARRVNHESPVGAMPIQTAEDVILSKLDWRKDSQSEKQLRDVVGVFDTWRSKLDAAYLRQWADVLGVREEVETLYRRPE